MPERICSQCHESKPVAEYYMRAGKPVAACKTCTKAQVAAYQQANPEKVRGWQKAHYRRDPKRAQARMATWAAGPGREKYLASRKRGRQRTPEERKAYWAKYSVLKREELRAARKARYDPAKKRASRTAKQGRLDRERRRARLLAAYVEDTPFDDVLIRDLGVCGICSKNITENTIELDHVIPLAAGGTHEMRNVQLAHRACNRRKCARLDYSPTSDAA